MYLFNKMYGFINDNNNWKETEHLDQTLGKVYCDAYIFRNRF